MLKKSEIMVLIQEAGLDAQFRENCGNEWSDGVNQISKVPTYYLEHLVNYQSIVFKYLSKNLIEISLVIYNDKKVCAVWPLYLDINKKEPIKSINDQYGGIVVSPLFIENFPKKSERKIIKACIRFLNTLLTKSKGKVWRSSELSAKVSVSQWHQLCLENGALLDKVCYEMYVDLSLSINQIRSFIRKSYRPLISSGLKKWTVSVMDQYCEATWNDFRILHKHVSGRVTRPIESWDVQHNAIKAGDAFLVYVSDSEGKMVGGGFFDMSCNEGNYSVATYDKNLTDQPLGHMVQYQAILTLKEKGKSLYYIGSRFYIENLPDVSDKQVDISSFKAGFSTFMVPRVVLSFPFIDKN
jgi:FemAB family protein